MMGKRRNVRAVVVAALAAAVGVLLALTTAAAASSTATVSPRDNCGGFNGYVVWSGSSIQVYGEVWDTRCSGSTSVWLAWDSPSYHNIQAGSASEPNTTGVNYKTATQQTPNSITVTVCSTSGGWHCGAGAYVNQSPPGTTTTTTTSTIVIPPPTTTTTTIVTTPVPVPAHKHARHSRQLCVQLKLGWTWHGRTTWLRTVKIGKVPRQTGILVRCLGRGCQRPASVRAHGERRLDQLLSRLRDRRYRAGDRLLLTLAATGWTPERIKVTIRSGKLPRVALLGR